MKLSTLIISLVFVGAVPESLVWADTATTTRYWDCSGGSCGCAYLPPHLNGDHSAPSHCYSNGLFAAPAGNAHGAKFYGAAAISEALGGGGWLSEGCGKCWKLSGMSNIPGHDTSTVTTIVLKGTNFCPPANPSCANGKKHFDIAAPGFDYVGSSISNSCAKVEPTESDAFRSCGSWMINSQNPNENCDCGYFSNPVLRDGCLNFKSLNWNNPTVSFEEVACPYELAQLPCWEENGNTYPWPNAPSLCLDPLSVSAPTNPIPTHQVPAPTNPPPTSPVPTYPLPTNPAPTSLAPVPTNPVPAPTNPTDGGRSCCSWNYKDCGQSDWCNVQQSNCETVCGGQWLDLTMDTPGNDYCCSWNGNTCGSDSYCSSLESNCVANCNGSWISKGGSP